MKIRKRILAGLLTAVMAVSPLQLSTVTVLAEENSSVTEDMTVDLEEVEKEEKELIEAEVLERSDADNTQQHQTEEPAEKSESVTVPDSEEHSVPGGGYEDEDDADNGEDTDIIEIESIKLDIESLSLNVGETANIQAIVFPYNVADTMVTWESSDISVCTVEDGMISAIAVGNCIITVSAGDESASCEVTVTESASYEMTVTEDEEITHEGSVNENYGEIAWMIDAEGKLTVTGTGDFSDPNDMPGLQSSIQQRAPWYSYRESIQSAEIKVKDMTNASWMFYNCNNLVNVDISNFNTSRVTEMSGMFYSCGSLASIDLSGLNTGQVTTMNAMFGNCKSLASIDLSGLNTSQVTTMSGMFSSCSSLASINLSGLDTSQVTTMNTMFRDCSSLTSIDLSGLDTSQVTTMKDMFYQCSQLRNADLSGLNASNVKDMSDMFLNCSKLENVDFSDIDTSNVTSMTQMFNRCESIRALDLSSLDTSNVTNMASMFSGCESIRTLDLSSLDTGNLVNMSYMFYNCTNLLSLDMRDLDLGKVEDASNLFNKNKAHDLNIIYTPLKLNCAADLPLGTWYKPDGEEISTFPQNLGRSIMIMRNTIPTVKEEEEEIVREVIDEDYGHITWVIDNNGKLTVTGTGDYSNSSSSDRAPWSNYVNYIKSAEINVTDMTDASYMFYNCHIMTSVDMSRFDTSNITDMNHMFNDCYMLNNMKMGSFDTAQVTNMSYMFSGCEALKNINTNNFNTGHATNMSRMFYGCDRLSSIDVSSFDTRHVTNMSRMFSHCAKLESIDLSKFNTSLVTDMSSMFSYCEALENIDLRSFNTSLVTDMNMMFDSCYKLSSIDVSSFDTSLVTDMGGMFKACNNLKILDLSSFDTSQVSYMREILHPCSGLSTIYTPLGLNLSVSLPEGTWYKSDGTEITELPQELDYSIVITKGSIPVTDKAYIIAYKSKTVYECGDELNLEDLTVEYHDENGNVSTVTAYSTNVSTIDMSTEGTKTLIITYNDLKYKMKLTVIKKGQGNIEAPYITASKTKTVYECGDELNLEDLIVEYYDEEGNVTAVTTYSTNASTIDMSTEGTKILIITYNDLTYEIELTVTKKGQGNTEESYITASKTKTVYECGDELNLEDLKVEYHDEEGNVTAVTTYSTNASTIDMSTEGTKILIITYNDLTYEIELTVTKKSGSGNSQDDDNKAAFRIRFVNEEDKKSLYTGTAITPAIKVTNNGKELIEGIDYIVKYSNNVNASEKAKITVIGKGGWTGSTSEIFTIEKKNLSDSDVEIAGVELDGNGNVALDSAGSPSLLVTERTYASPVLIYYGVKLTSKDFTVEGNEKWTENGSITIKAKTNSNFSGERKLNIKVISKKDLKKFTVTVDKSVTYDGEKHELIPVVKDSKTKENLAETDYIVTYSKDVINAGTVKVTVVGRGCYTGSVTKSYKIKPRALNTGIEVKLNDEKIANGYTFKSNGVILNKEDLTVTYEGMPLNYGADYKVTCSNNKTVGNNAKYKVTFIGNYKGSKAISGNFTINKATLNDDTDGLKILVPDMVYTGRAGIYKSAPYVSISGISLKSSCYAVTYWADPTRNTNEIKGRENNITVIDEPITVYVKIVAKGKNYETPDGTYATAEYKVYPKPSDSKYNLSKAKITLTFKDKDGNIIKKPEFIGDDIEVEAAEIKVECKSGRKWETVPADEYTVEYVNNVYKGKATVIIKAKAGSRLYAGSKIAAFNIVAHNLSTGR